MASRKSARVRVHSNQPFRHSPQKRLVPYLELLEDRTVPSGSSFSLPIGPLPAGRNVTVQFDATVDSPATKGINLLYNQGSVSGGNFATVKTDDSSQAGTTDPTTNAVNLAPMVSNVFLRSSTWNSAFLTNLQTQSAGDSTFGYSVPGGSNQTANLPWYNLDRVSIRFSENVNVAADDLQLFGVTVPNYGLSGFVYDNTTFTATWSITTQISNDQLRVVLDGSASGVTESLGGNRLDGEWLDNTAVFSSGNGAGGGDFSFRASILGGDTNQDGVVNTTDTVLVRNAIGGNNVFRDVNGDSAVNTTDFVITRASIGQVPPVGTPGGTPGSGWLPTNVPVPPNPPGGPANTISATKTSILLTDLNSNGLVDAGDTLRYTILVTNTGASTATAVVVDDTLDNHTTLVSGSLNASPLAFDDVYSANDDADLIVSNPALGLFNNDVEFLGDTFTLQGFTQPGATGATVTVNNDGTFTYHPANPFNGADTFTYTIVDSQGLTSTGTVTVNVTHIATNNAPVLNNIEAAALAYTENQAATAITAALTVTDSDSPNLTGATVSITAGFASAEDVLAFTNQNGITGSYNTGTGVLTLSGSSSVANYQTALRSITYFNSSNTPSTTTRTISFQVDDGAAANNLSNIVTRNITVVAVNDNPVLAAIEGTNLPYTENQAATAITAALTVTDSDSPNLTGATVSITAGFASAEDVLAFTNQNGITGSYNTGTGVLTLSGSSSVANYQTALRSITYFNSSENPSTTTRTISFRVDDGAAANNLSNIATRNIAITAVNDSPVLAAIEGAALAYTENQAATAITATLTVNDVDSANLTGATVSITTGFAGAEDVLAFTNQNGITGSYNTGTGVMTLSGSSSVANYQTALRSITYVNNSNNPSGTTRTISFQVNDGGAVNNLSSIVTRNINVTAVNDNPVLAAIEGTNLAYTENQAATAITATLTVSDVDSANLTGATVSITTGFVGAQDVLAFTNQNGITGSYNTGTGVLTLSGSSSVANYQTALRSITYFNNSENPSTTTRTISFRVDDGSASNNLSNIVTRNIAVTAVNDAPALANIEGTAVAYNQNAAATAITGAITISDVDSVNLTGATVTISTGYVNGQDVLSFTNQLGITGSFAAATGILTLTGTTTLANYQTALRAVQFSNSQGATNTAARTISFQVNDGGAVNNLSSTVTRNITINRAPTGVVESFTPVGNTQFFVGVTPGSTPAASVAGSVLSNDTDVEGNTPITVGTTNTAGLAGTLAMNSNGTFTFTPNVGFTGATSFTYTAVDSLGAVSNPITVTLTVTSRVWYVDSTAGTTGDGRSNNPFDSLADVTGATGGDAAGDIIYLHERSGDYNGNFTLLDNQQLIGGGVDLIVGGFTLQATTSKTTWVTTVAATNAITLASGNTIRGFTIGNTTGTKISGGVAGNLTINTVSLNGTGAAINIATSGALTVTLDDLTSTSSTTAVNLVGVSGTFTANSGAISGATGTDFNVGSGTASITFGGPITNTAGTSVVVSGHTGGTILFSGAITDTGSGISLTSNGGTTINFTGGLTLNTGANTALTATGGGTINVTGTNTIGATTALSAPAVNIANTTIGASGVNFQRISVSGGANGILLNNTGSGGFTVTGTGTTDGSGGTIQNTTGRGASFISASNISLRNMTFTNAGTSDLDATNGGLSTGDNLDTNAAIHLVTVTTVTLDNVDIAGGAEQGINGNTVANFVLTNSTITNVGNAADEDNIHFFNMSGTSAITNTTLTHTSGGGDDNMNLQTNAGNLDLVISGGSAVGVAGGVNQLGSGYLFGIRGTTIANISFEGVSSTNNFSGGIVADAFDSATMNLRVNSSTSSGNNDQLSVSAGDNSLVDLEATGNTLSSVATGDFVVVSLLGSAFDTGYVFDARIHSNTITVANGLTADGMLVFNAGGGTMNIAITNNTFDYAGTQRAIALQAGQDGSGITRPTITGNNVDIKLDGAGNAVTGFLVQTAITGPGNTSSVNARIGGAGALANVFTHSLGGTMAGGDIRVRQRNDGTVNLDGYGGGATDTAAVVTYLAGRNTVVSPSTATADSSGFAGAVSPAFITVAVAPATVLEDAAPNMVYTLTRNGSTAASLVVNFAITGTASASSDFSVSGATSFNTGTGLGTVTFNAGSATATLTIDPTADANATEFDESVVVDVGNSTTANGSFARGVITDDAPMLAAAGGVQSAKPLPKATNLRPSDLTSIVAEAIRRWSTAGLTTRELASLRSVSVQIADLPGQYLGTAPLFGKTITLDINAAGYGWFIDRTPRDDAEFGVKGSGMKRFTTSTQAPAGRMDLLTVVMHEFSHILGMDSSFNPADSDTIVSAYLTTGTRLLPGGQTATRVPSANTALQESQLLTDLLFLSTTTKRRQTAWTN